MTYAEIITSIQNWEAIRQDSVAMNDFFDKGNSFTYNFPAYASASNFLHAYPGIYNDELYFFVIPEEYDKQEYASVIDQYTIPCMIGYSLGDSRLTPQQAKARMKAWDKDHVQWVTAQVGSQYGMFEAFVIPTEDCEVENVIMSLGLKINTAATGGFEADIIVTNDDGKLVVYDDFSSAVPPFGATAVQNDFYLLTASFNS